MSTTPTNEGSFTLIPIEKILRVDAENDRTKYNPELLKELKDSIRSYGVRQNIGVGPMNEDGLYPLQWGYRRHKATEELLDELAAEGTKEASDLLMSRSMMPCRVLTLGEMLNADAFRLIENLQREGLDPVDEARGYRKLLDKRRADGEPLYTVGSLAAALAIEKKGEDYIRLRLKLLSAPEFLLDAVREKEGPAVRVAEIIGRMANPKHKEEAAKRAVKDKYTGRPMTVKAVMDMVQREFQQSLRGCDFDTEAADLLTDLEKQEYGFTGAPGEACDGSCARCPLRSGNDPTLKGLIAESLGDDEGVKEGIDTMICQHTACFATKQKNAWRAIERNAEASGYRVMHKERVKEYLPYGDWLTDAAKKIFIRQDERPDYTATGHMSEESLPTWGELLKDTSVSWILARAKTGKKLYLLERQTAIDTVEATPATWEGCPGGKNPFANRPGAKKGKGKATEAVPAVDVTKPQPKAEKAAAGMSNTGGKRDGQAEAKEREKREAEKYKVERVLIEQCGEKPMEMLSEETRRAIVQDFESAADCCELLGSYLGLWVTPPEDWSEKHKAVDAKLSSMPLPHGEFINLLLLMQVFSQYNDQPKESLHAPLVRMMAKDLGIDLAACRAKALGTEEGTEPEGTEAPSEEVPSEQDYECDGCQRSITVPGANVAEVDKMKSGEFLCTNCGGTWVAWPDEKQPEYVTKKLKQEGGKAPQVVTAKLDPNAKENCGLSGTALAAKATKLLDAAEKKAAKKTSKAPAKKAAKKVAKKK